MPGKALIGLSARTTREGAEALIEVLATLGYRGEIAADAASICRGHRVARRARRPHNSDARTNACRRKRTLHR